MFSHFCKSPDLAFSTGFKQVFYVKGMISPVCIEIVSIANFRHVLQEMAENGIIRAPGQFCEVPHYIYIL